MSAPPGARIHRRAAFARLLTGGRAHPPGRERRHARRDALAHPKLALWRRLVGWFVVVLGILGIVLPGLPALVLIPAGVALVGRRTTAVRWCRTRMKLWLRRAEVWPGIFGRTGRFLRGREAHMAKFLRDRRLGRWERRELR
jgi:hypothetical protein